jgi:hypothetical protein
MPTQHFTADSPRGMFIILPLKYDQPLDLAHLKSDRLGLPIIQNSPQFYSTDFIQLMNHKCAENEGFVRRWVLDLPADTIVLDAPFTFSDFQVFIFNNGIAFVTAFLQYTNADVHAVYEFLQPGYTKKVGATLREAFIEQIEVKLINKLHPHLTWFTDDYRCPETDDGSALTSYRSDLITKDAYRLNVAFADQRFSSPEAIQQPTYNLHRMVDLNRDFTDTSEHDLAYVTGAKDVDDEQYGWGCAITSQEASYIYATDDLNASLPDAASDDLLLCMLVMYQKYESMNINEKIHSRYMKADERTPASVRDLKQEALNLIAYETLAPSQISRWNNVSEIYRNLLDLTGVNETIAEVKDKITLLTDEQDRRDAARDNAISMVITVFGLVSIISAILQTVDYLDSRSPVMWVSFIGSLAVVLVFGIYLGMRWTRKRG